ncbi:MAG: helix-turn-helix domain-containing protein [Candidatus Diapherotrites archaeon]|nr:helix-turn-helix domain-containing protein [Candidatus Diapherotrites archaeon]
MFEAKLLLAHKGCWTNGLKKFKSTFTTHNTICLDCDSVCDILEINAFDENQKKQIIKYLQKNDVVKKIEILEENNLQILMQVFTDTSKITSVVHTILENNCFVSNKIHIVDGKEIWCIASSKKIDLKNALDGLKKLGKLKLIYLKKTSFDGFNLTQSQEKTLKTALKNQYFEWPKKTTLSEIAKKTGVSKATAAEHLRKAEIKIIKRTFENF